MKRVKFHMTIGYANANREETFTYPDDTPDEVIEQDLIDWKTNYLEYSWWEVK